MQKCFLVVTLFDSVGPMASHQNFMRSDGFRHEKTSRVIVSALQMHQNMFSTAPKTPQTSTAPILKMWKNQTTYLDLIMRAIH